MTLLCNCFVIYVRVGGVDIPNMTFTVMVTAFVSILLILINSTLLYFPAFNSLLGRGKGLSLEPSDDIKLYIPTSNSYVEFSSLRILMYLAIGSLER
jgi:hypothetical protein